MTKIRIQIWERGRNQLYFVRDFVDFEVKRPLTYDEGLVLDKIGCIIPPRNGRLTVEVIE